jgi:hypothetical protein
MRPGTFWIYYVLHDINSLQYYRVTVFTVYSHLFYLSDTWRQTKNGLDASLAGTITSSMMYAYVCIRGGAWISEPLEENSEKFREKFVKRMYERESKCKLKRITYSGKSPIMGRFPNMGRCIISYQEVLSSLLKNVHHQADEAILCTSNNSINGMICDKRSVAQDLGTEWASLLWCAVNFLLIAKLWLGSRWR